MEVVYKSPTELASARKEWGLPYQKLPGTIQEDITPETMLRQEIRSGQKQIQDRFALQWKEIDRSGQFIGKIKANRMLDQLHAKAKQEMLTFNQKVQTQMTQLQNIDRLAEQGMLDNADYLKAYQVFGPQTARTMYPKPEKEKEARQIPEMFGKLDVYGDKLAGDRAQFRIVGEPLPKPPSKLLGLISPVMGAISARQKISRLKEIKKRGRKGDVQIWDPTIPVRVKDPDTGVTEDLMGDWRKADREEITAYEFILKEIKAVARRKTELQSRFGISQRMGLGTNKGGGFNDGVAESVRGPVTRQPITRQLVRPQPQPQPQFSDPLGLR